jgi:solute carrier family 25 phosphate transporter 3
MEIKTQIPDTHDRSYYMKCFFAGLFPCGLTHTLLTPLDVVKCRRQVYPGEYKGLVQGLKIVWSKEGLRGLFLGWQPTIIGYSIQGSTKYGFYEIFKDQYSRIFGKDFAQRHRTSGYLFSSAVAEVVADTLLCPWEKIKVRMQTSPPGTFPNQLAPAITTLNQEGLRGYYIGLLPVIMRQVPNTMVKFATYENTVKFFYTHIFKKNKREYGKFTQLTVTFISGYVAGIFCCLVSNPADTIVSKINTMKADKKVSLVSAVNQIYKEIGFLGLWRGLSTRIIMVGTLSALEWLIYDFFKTMAGLQTTGNK